MEINLLQSRFAGQPSSGESIVSGQIETGDRLEDAAILQSLDFGEEDLVWISEPGD